MKPSGAALIAAAIVLAGALIGAGLYLGLSASRSPAAVPSPIASAAPDAVQAEASAWLEAQRSALSARCWRATPGEPELARYTFVFTVDERGREIGRGLIEHREALRADVGACLRAQIEPRLVVQAPGRVTTVEVTTTLP